jgi:hypothetical protein
MSWKPAFLAFVTTVLLGLLLSGFVRTSPGAREAGGQPPARVEQPASSRDVAPAPSPRFYVPAQPARELKTRRIV